MTTQSLPSTATQRRPPSDPANTTFLTPPIITTMMGMSFEAVLDEERREVLALLEATPPSERKTSTSSTASGKGRRKGSNPFAVPRSPVRSMVDVDGQPPAHRPASMSGESSYLSPPPRTLPVRSMLDVSSPPSKATSKSAQTSPTEANSKSSLFSGRHRSLSDAANYPIPVGQTTTINTTADTNDEPFPGLSPSSSGAPVTQKRVTQGGGWAKKLVPSAMAEVVRGGDLSTFGSRESGRNSSVVSLRRASGKSRSPHTRWSLRSSSPKSEQAKYDTKDGQTVDTNKAYRRLSDANLAQSGSSLSILSTKSRRRTNSGASYTGGGRLTKDIATGEEAVADSSDDDSRSSEEDQHRGRKKAGRDETDHDIKLPADVGKANGPRIAQSQMAAAEEERREVAHQIAKKKVRSIVEPEITVTRPTGERARSSRLSVHPNTSFDVTPSGINTPMDSDTEADITDIKRAQRLSVNMTAISTTPTTHRCVRTLYRGDFSKMQRESLDNQRRVRKYLVATDMSDEAAHALEWTIGTVLRDGDTLLAIYCVDEEVGIAQADTSGDDAQMKEQVAAIAQSTKPCATPIMSPALAPSPLSSGFRLDKPSSTSSSPVGRLRSKPEQERYQAVQDITERVTRLLRKTKLQVKVVIEVIHCKSPKHLITEVIDFISPTLVILGSRGRSALKGVILGSFSNYLVTKSSVPVMVARKRLRKHTKYKRPEMRLANNLSNPVVRSLASAKID